MPERYPVTKRALGYISFKQETFLFPLTMSFTFCFDKELFALMCYKICTYVDRRRHLWAPCDFSSSPVLNNTQTSSELLPLYCYDFQFLNENFLVLIRHAPFYNKTETSL